MRRGLAPCAPSVLTEAPDGLRVLRIVTNSDQELLRFKDLGILTFGAVFSRRVGGLLINPGR